MDQRAAEAALEAGQAHRADAARHLAVDHRQEPEARFARRCLSAKLSPQILGSQIGPEIHNQGRDSEQREIRAPKPRRLASGEIGAPKEQRGATLDASRKLRQWKS